MESALASTFSALASRYPARSPSERAASCHAAAHRRNASSSPSGQDCPHRMSSSQLTSGGTWTATACRLVPELNGQVVLGRLVRADVVPRPGVDALGDGGQPIAVLAHRFKRVDGGADVVTRERPA